MKKLLSLFMALWATMTLYSQCGSNVPTIVIDLSSNPDTTWTLIEAEAPNRLGQCCGVGGNENCIQFEITLHPNAAGIFFDYDGAGAFGSLNWRIDCGTPYSLKDTICVTETGPFTLTFCKPGSDNGNYSLISVPKPTFPEDQFVPMNCEQPVEVLGVTASTVNWISISPGAPGQYNSLLSCTNCLTPVFSPDPNGPSEIEYRVCGYPILDYCVGNFQFCDTVKFTVQDSLKLSISPLQPAFCSGGSIQLTAQGTGGDGNYSYIWYNSSLQIVGTGPTFDAFVAGSYTCELRDGNFQTGYCDGFFANVNVVETFPPVVNAGPDVVLCAASPNAELNGVFSFAQGVQWSGGSGTFQDGVNSASNTYVPTNAEIQAGSVTLTLSSVGVGGGCSNTTDNIQLFFVDTVETNLTNQVLLCNNGSISINPVITGGMNPFTYSWTNGDNTASTTLSQGFHCLTIVDGNNCQTVHCVNISSPTELDLVMSSTPVTVNFGSDGTASVNVSGGVGPYSYSWSNGGTSSSISGVPYGLYTVEVTDANGCVRFGSVVVNEPRCDGYFVNAIGTNASCFGSSNGSATVNISNGFGPFTISWSDPMNQFTPVATNLSAGIYSVTVTDANNCVAISTATVNEPTPIINSMSHVDVTIQGGIDGSAMASVSGGISPYTYSWSNGSMASAINGVIADVYYLTITDANGCTLTDSVQVSEPPCNTFFALIGTVSPICNGDQTAEANLTLLNGVGPYSISWSTGQTNVQSVSNILAGFHSVEIIDSRGCEIFQTFGISEPSPLSIGMIPTPSTCNGMNNGTIDVTVNGGTYPYYYYNWSNGANSEDQIFLSPGSYSLTVLDENGCTASASTTITEPLPLSVTHTETNVTCFGGSDASIDVTVSGGTLPYNYNWSNGANSEDLNNIDIGGYILNLVDANFCSTSQPLTILITEPSLVEIQNIDIACPIPGAATAEVIVTPIGGNADYTVSYDGGMNFGSIADYTADLPVDASYSVIVADASGCQSAASNITVDTNVTILSANFNLCYTTGQTNELVNVNIGGGTPDYSVSFDGGTLFGPLGTSSLNLPINASYTLTAKDVRGCNSEPYMISLPQVFDHTTSVSSNFNGSQISCNGQNDGEVTSVVTGGTLPYSFNWSNGSTNNVASGLGAGTYSLTITDASNCILTTNVTVSEPAALTSPINILTDFNGYNIDCNGGLTGTIETITSGGTGSYLYLWSNGASTAQVSGLAAGNYDLTVTDVNGCTVVNAVSLTEPSLLSATMTIEDVSCNGGDNGSIDLVVNGGVQPYNYNWSNGVTTEDLDQLTEGDYSVDVTDANGCIVQLNQLIVHPTTIVLSTNPAAVLCHGTNSGSIDLTVAGGTPPYLYNWSNGEQTEDVNLLVDGNYSVTVTDANGCYTSISTDVLEPDTLSLTYQLSDPSCFGYDDGSISVQALGGMSPYVISWSNNIDPDNLEAGTYDLTITDANGCVHQSQYTLDQPQPLVLNLNSPFNDHDHNIDLHGGSDGAINSDVTGGTQPYDYVWSNNSTDANISGLIAGQYSLTVTDAQGCVVSNSILLIEPDALDLPTIFTPNNDGYNDVFEILGIEAYPDNELIVVNRWGNQIFKTSKYENTWEGTNQSGDPLPDGVYYVILKINGGEIERNVYVHIKRH